MDEDQLIQLLQKHRAGTLSDAEQVQWQALIASDEARPQLERLMQQEMEAIGRLTDYDPADWEAVFNKIVHIDHKQYHTIHTRQVRWWWAAAAAILLVAGTGIYFLSRQVPGTGIAIGPNNNDVLPGVNKAILTLADGTAVTLDSAGNQVILQGATAIRQQGGQLQYDTREAGATTVYNTLGTPRGGQFQVRLPDGTRVWLNAASSVRYPTAFSGRERQVWVKGEAFFEVAQHAEHPFVVTVEGGMKVQVLGTAFNIRAYPEDRSMEATLVNGAVRVSHDNESSLLHPGEMAHLQPGHGLETARADLAAVTAWKENKFVFHNIPVTAMLEDIARWYDVEIVYTPGFNKKEHYNGEISRNVPLSTLLKMIEKSAVGRFSIEGRTIRALPVVE